MQFVPEEAFLQIRFYTAFQAGSGGPPATFRFLLRELAPGSGMRDGVAFLQEQFPTHFSSSLPLYSFQDRAQGNFLTEERAQEIQQLDEANMYAAQYTLSEFAFSVAPSSEPEPTLGEALAHVEATLGSERPAEAAYAEAFTRSAVMRLSGFPALKFVGEPAWNQGNWEAGWPANFHPDITGGIADWMIQWRVDPAFSASAAVGAVLDGVQIDNFLSVPALDHRTEVLASFPNQLVFDPNNLQPAYPIAFGMEAFLRHLRSHVDQTWGTDRGISVNFWGLANPNFLLGKVDAFGNEGHTNSGYGRNWNPEILDYRRVMTGSRPMFFANQTSGLGEAEAQRFCSLALLFGIRPGFGPNANGWDPAAERLIEETSNLVASYWDLLWRPLPRAQAEGYRVERFGDDLRQGLVFAVFHPTGNLLGGSLFVDETLGTVPEGFRLEVQELLSGTPVPVDQGMARKELPLGPFQKEETKVFRLQLYPESRFFYRDALYAGADWWWLPWLGYFRPAGEWIGHAQHGWLYGPGSSPANLWLWDQELGWLWTSETGYPLLFSNSLNTWLRYEPGSVDPRWFYHYSEDRWFPSP